MTIVFCLMMALYPLWVFHFSKLSNYECCRHLVSPPTTLKIKGTVSQHLFTIFILQHNSSSSRHLDDLNLTRVCMYTTHSKPVFLIKKASHHHHFIVFIPVFNWCKPRKLFKRIPETLCICIAHIIHYFINIFAAGFKLPFGCLYFYTMYILHY